MMSIMLCTQLKYIFLKLGFRLTKRNSFDLSHLELSLSSCFFPHNTKLLCLCPLSAIATILALVQQQHYFGSKRGHYFREPSRFANLFSKSSCSITVRRTHFLFFLKCCEFPVWLKTLLVSLEHGRRNERRYFSRK